MNVLLPLIVKAPAPEFSRIGHVLLPPAKVLADPEVMLMVPDPVTVRFVEVEQSHAEAPAPLTVHVPEPNARVRVLELEEAKVPVVTLYVTAANVP